MKPIVYSFSFAHHGRYSSYHRLLEYLPQDFVRVNAHTRSRLLQRSPRLLRLWLRVNEYRLLPRMHKGAGRCVHYLYPENSVYAGLRWLNGNKMVVTWHQPLSYLKGLPEPFRSHAQSILQRATAVIFLSEDSMRAHVESLNLVNSCSIKHGVDIDFFSYRERVPTKPYIDVITVGNWLRDHRCWAETIRLLLRKESAFRFTVLCNSYNAALYQSHLAMRDERVRFVANLNDEGLRSFYGQADVSFLPLHAATANNSLLECMASGVPCVVSDLQATREYAGNSVVFVDNSDVSATADAILKLASSRSRCAEMAKSARLIAERELSWQVIAQQHCKLYDSTR
jgi:glycosyltransferase involved in cell wall biosynthesis